MDAELKNILAKILESQEEMRNDISDIKSEISGIKSEQQGMKIDIQEMKAEQQEMKTEIININNKLDEHTLILRSLEHASEVHKAEIDKVNYAIVSVEGEVKGIREDIFAVEMITSKNWNDITKLKAVK